jgi:hypothetical protein
MPALFSAIPVPGAGGVGASLNVAGMGPLKAFVVQEAGQGVSLLQASLDGVGWFDLADGRLDAANGHPLPILVYGCVQFVRVNRERGAGAPPVIGVGADGLAGNAFGSLAVPQTGTGILTDSSGWGICKTFAVEGRLQQGAIFVEGSQDDVAWNTLAHFPGPFDTGTLTAVTVRAFYKSVRVRRTAFTQGDNPGVQFGQGPESAAGLPVFGPAGANSVAVPPTASAPGQRATAYGDGAQAVPDDSVAVGWTAIVQAGSDASMAIGGGAFIGAGNQATVAIGNGANSGPGNNASTILGVNAYSASPGSVSIGNNAAVNPGGDDSVAVGRNVAVGALRAVALGQGVTVNADDSVGIGGTVGGGSNNSVVIGRGASSSGGNPDCVIIGSGAIPNGPQAIGLGRNCNPNANEFRAGDATAPINDVRFIGVGGNQTLRAQNTPGAGATGIECYADVGAGPVPKGILAAVAPPGGSFILYVNP